MRLKLLDERAGPVITGGAWGTELQARGLPMGALPDTWNILRPTVVEELASEYAAAGSHIVLTNTFQSNRVALDRHGLGDEIGRINRLGAVHVRRAVDERALVFGSMGPVGPQPKQVQSDAFCEQAEALAEAKVDGLVIETMTDLQEAMAALASAKSTGLPVVVTLSVGYGDSPDRLNSGEEVGEALDRLVAEGADRVGINCMEPGKTLALCSALATRLSAPLWVKPNAGTPMIIDGVPRYALTPSEFAVRGYDLVLAGAAYVGGCCGIGPDHVRALAGVLSAYEASSRRTGEGS